MARLTKSSYVKIVLVCLLCLMICGTLTGGLAFVRHAIDAWNSPWDQEHRWTPSESDQTGAFSIDANSVSDISISWLAGTVNVLVVPDAETEGMIQVSEATNSRVPLRWRNNDGELQIDYGSLSGLYGCSWVDRGSKELTVLVPQSHASAIGTFSLDAASGEYMINGLNCNYLNLNQASGRVRFNDFVAQGASFSIASGSLDYRGDVASALEVDQASGQVTLALQTVNPSAGNLSMASGSLYLALPSSDFQLALSKLSGSFDCAYETYSRGDMYFGSALGPNQASSSLSMDMLSGNFQIAKSG